MMKGVSPLVASVLLISFTMAIAAILASWATQYMTQQTKTLKERGEGELGACLNARLAIVDFTYTGNTLAIVLENKGSVALTNLTVYSYSSATDVQKRDVGGYILRAHELKSFVVNDMNNTVKFKVATQCVDVFDEKVI